MTVQDLPLVNASLNALSTLFICAGLAFIQAERKLAHITCMVLALVTSTAFLACYVTYHYLKAGHVTSFTHPGWPKTLYFFILFTHIPLAVAVLPLVTLTVIPALRAATIGTGAGRRSPLPSGFTSPSRACWFMSCSTLFFRREPGRKTMAERALAAGNVHDFHRCGQVGLIGELG